MTIKGLTLRDYFAVHATDDEVAEIMNNHWWREEVEEKFRNGGSRMTTVVKHPTDQQARYIYADLMMKARDK